MSEQINKYILARFNKNFYLHDTKVFDTNNVLLHFRKIQTVQGNIDSNSIATILTEPTAPPEVYVSLEKDNSK